jgi:Fe-S oxidoreductase
MRSPTARASADSSNSPVVSRSSGDVPRFARPTLRAWFAGHAPLHPDGPPVLLWPDTFTNHFEPEVGIAAVGILEAAGHRVLLPERPLCCGRPLYDYGMLTLARRYLRRVLAGIRTELADGVPVIDLEPSCLAVFREELTNLFPDDADARRLATQSVVLSEFLTEKADWSLPRLNRRAVVQPHCHHQAVIGFDAEQSVLQGMGLDVEVPDSGCCGMAGSFGYEAGQKYDVSTAAGERAAAQGARCRCRHADHRGRVQLPHPDRRGQRTHRASSRAGPRPGPT